jgi:hypothetical protein
MEKLNHKYKHFAILPESFAWLLGLWTGDCRELESRLPVMSSGNGEQMLSDWQFIQML